MRIEIAQLAAKDKAGYLRFDRWKKLLSSIQEVYARLAVLRKHYSLERKKILSKVKMLRLQIRGQGRLSKTILSV